MLIPSFQSRINATTIINDEIVEQERTRLKSKDKLSKNLIEKLSGDLKRH